ncbi:GNAT family N-acetyltransferase [Methylobrevis pamukkalensis]|uniref:Putative ribosomal N-acetyltransferase YdaF n=1 Tax=Methylobrevis pamukkalensis TaxID=1439726 RepID=A0A1E3H8H0_9HYPH|nr:GNAT family N-acetyltransferase [Methylobrevis pamukkalensis]ODN72584.1 putative ribosomal N-acetyltransferase YdaF [Methylobrevis pamukkalensis]
MRMPTLATPRLRLDATVDADAPAISAALSDPAVAGWLARVPFPYELAHARMFLAHAERSRRSGEAYVFAIRQRAGTDFLGLVGLQGLPGNAEVGYWLAQAHWGNGYATEAVREVLAFAFADLGLRVVRSGVFLGNDASMRVQTKLGFTITGQSLRVCEAKGGALPHIDTILSRDGVAQAPQPGA